MENAGFLQVAGLTYEIDLSVPNTVKTDDKSVWLAGPDKYRVTNVRVYDKGTGTYVPWNWTKLTRWPESTYTVVSGDCLWNIASILYGDGIKWLVTYEANRGIIKNPDLIWPGQVFVIPAA